MALSTEVLIKENEEWFKNKWMWEEENKRAFLDWERSGVWHETSGNKMKGFLCIQITRSHIDRFTSKDNC